MYLRVHTLTQELHHTMSEMVEEPEESSSHQRPVVEVEEGHGDQNNNNSSSSKKRVRLAQDPPTVNVFCDDTTESDRDLIWWQQEDFDNAKASVKRLCRELRQERRFSGCLTDAYEKACCMERQQAALMEQEQQSQQQFEEPSPIIPVDAQHVEVSVSIILIHVIHSRCIIVHTKNIKS
jgi:hypothetical protein